MKILKIKISIRVKWRDTISFIASTPKISRSLNLKKTVPTDSTTATAYLKATPRTISISAIVRKSIPQRSKKRVRTVKLAASKRWKQSRSINLCSKQSLAESLTQCRTTATLVSSMQLCSVWRTRHRFIIWWSRQHINNSAWEKMDATNARTLILFKVLTKINGLTRYLLLEAYPKFGMATGSGSKGTRTNFWQYTLNRFWTLPLPRSPHDRTSLRTKKKLLFLKFLVVSCVHKSSARDANTNQTLSTKLLLSMCHFLRGTSAPLVMPWRCSVL